MPGLLNFLGGFAVLLTISFSAVAFVPLALAYVALRVRDARNPEPDPALGAKTAYHTIHSLGILMLLVGLSVSAIDLMVDEIAPKQPVPAVIRPGLAPPQPQKEKGFNGAQRTAVALAGVGSLFTLLFWGLLLTGTNDRTHRAVRRVFIGGRMTLCLLVTMIAVAGLVIVLIQKDPDYKLTESFLAILIVWLPAAFIHMVIFRLATRQPKSRRDDSW